MLARLFLVSISLDQVRTVLLVDELFQVLILPLKLADAPVLYRVLRLKQAWRELI